VVFLLKVQIILELKKMEELIKEVDDIVLRKKIKYRIENIKRILKEVD